MVLLNIILVSVKKAYVKLNTDHSQFFLIGVGLALLLFFSCSNNQTIATKQIPSFEEVIKSNRDLWGEAGMSEPNGASYEFFQIFPRAFTTSPIRQC